MLVHLNTNWKTSLWWHTWSYCLPSSFTVLLNFDTRRVIDVETRTNFLCFLKYSWIFHRRREGELKALLTNTRDFGFVSSVSAKKKKGRKKEQQIRWRENACCCLYKAVNFFFRRRELDHIIIQLDNRDKIRHPINKWNTLCLVLTEKHQICLF